MTVPHARRLPLQICIARVCTATQMRWSSVLQNDGCGVRRLVRVLNNMALRLERRRRFRREPIST